MLLFLGCTRPTSAASWTLGSSYVGTDFFAKWNFFTAADPTHGAVQYVDYEAAVSDRLVDAAADRVYLGASKVAGPLDGARRSVRIESKDVFNEGLFVVTLDHIPTGCGTWSAFWMFGADSAHVWPSWGEFDIIEGTHTTSSANTALHTSAGCDQSGVEANWNPGVSKPADNCDVAAPGQHLNQGCSQKGPPSSYGADFNGNGGGTFAAEWDPVGQQIRTWFWPSGSEPADLLAKIPQPDTWGAPFSRFSLASDSCPSSHFRNMRLVFDITFCGDLGNPTFGDFCPSEAARMTCEEFVASRPMPEAYWSLRTLDVYVRADALDWTRILCVVIVAATLVGAVVLIFRHTRGSTESGVLDPRLLARPGGRGAGKTFAAQVNFMRKAPVSFKWQQLATAPPSRASGDVLEDGYPDRAELLHVEAPAPVALHAPGQFNNVVTRETIQQELALFRAQTAQAQQQQQRPLRFPWSCGCCRQSR